MKRGAGELAQIAAESGRIALLATQEIKKALSVPDGGAPDTKTAKELSGVVKDMVALHRELSGERDARSLTVRFEGDTEAAAK